MRRLLTCLLACLLAAGLTACAGTGGGSKKGAYYIYYLNEDMNQLVREPYEPQSQTAEDLFQELAAALSGSPESGGYTALLTEDVTIQNCELEKGILTLNMSSAYKDMDKSREILTRAGLVRTFLQVEGVSRIQILAGGLPLLNSQNKEVGLLDGDSFVENSGKEINTYENVSMVLYFADEDGERLVPEQRSVYYSTNVPLERVVVEQLVKGPREEGHYAVLPPELNILSVNVSEGICYVNFDEGFTNSLMELDPKITIYSIVNSLAEVCHINRVQFSVNGKSDAVFGDTMNLDQLYEKDTSLIIEE